MVTALPPPTESEYIDLERADTRAGGVQAVAEPSDSRSRSATVTTGTSSIPPDKPRAHHEEYAQGYGPLQTEAPSSRPAMFDRTFTQQFRAAHLADVDFKNLSQKDKRAVVSKGLRSYFMDTNFKNRESLVGPA